MARTIRRKNYPQESAYLSDFQWKTTADGHGFIQAVRLDPQSPAGRRKWHDLHKDCGKLGYWGVPRGWRNVLNRSTRVAARTELVRVWREGTEAALQLDARTRRGWDWF